MDDGLESLYAWVDAVPLSRPKRTFTRDFADGVLVAEIVHHFQPRLVQLHNYSSANGLVYKQYNWQTLNQKVFRALGLHFTAEQLQDAAAARPGAAEAILAVLKTKLESLHMTEGPGGGSVTSAKHVGRTTSSGSVGAGDTIQAVHAAPAVDTQAELIAHFQQTIELLNVKVSKLEQLLQLKDAKIHGLTERLRLLEYSGGPQADS